MKKFIKDEMNINDIINPIDLNKVLYTVDSTKLGINKSLGNIIVVEYDGRWNNVTKTVEYSNKSILDLGDIFGIDDFYNEYVVLSITQLADNRRYIYLKQIPMI